MSKETIEKFFPAFVKFLTIQVPNGNWVFHDLLFPDATAEACPEISIHLPSMNYHADGITMRQPILFLSAIGGIVIGFYGAVRLRSVSYKWVVSYAAFGMMNIVAIWIHCLLEAPDGLYPESYPLLWMVDTYMTGVAASALTIACLETYYYSRDKSSNRSTANDEWDVMFWSIQGLGLLALASFIGNYIFWVLDLIGLSFLSALWLKTGKGRIPADPPSMEVTHALEMWYLVPPLIATVAAIQLFFGPIVGNQPTSQQRTIFPQWSSISSLRNLRISHIMFATSLIMPTILGIGLDRFWCWAIHSRQGGGTLAFFFWDLLTASTMTFLGCDLSYLAIFLWLNDSRSNKH